MKQPNVVMGAGCKGNGFDSFMFSFHQNYEDYDEFMLELKRECGGLIDDINPFLVNLGGNEILKPLSLKYLAEAM